jgi:hypothetical protein
MIPVTDGPQRLRLKAKQAADDLAIDPVCRDELETAEAWAIGERWNPGKDDLAVAWALDPQAFIALRRGGELIGGRSILAYCDRFGFVRLFNRPV